MFLRKITTLPLAFIFFVSFALFADDSCSILIKSPGYSSILVQNQGDIAGWVEIVNNMQHPVRLVNAYRPQFFFTLQPYERKSFNYKGTQEILCYKPTSDISLNRATDTQVNCSEVIAISKCYQEADTMRSPELALE